MHKASRLSLLLLVCSLAACHSRQYIHWEEDWREAADRASALTTDRDATVTLRTTQMFGATRLSLGPDSLSWAPPESLDPSTRRTLALAEIESVLMFERTRAGRGAWIGAAAGFLTAIPSLGSDGDDPGMGLAVAAILTVAGGVLGSNIGGAFREWIHLVP